ncbi:MAG: hypothetical protein JW934_16415 [Anaerolineae bacterium]|nr:hypothetical protein [Anaerolineae bacterium]
MTNRKLVGLAWLSPHERPQYEMFKIYVEPTGAYAIEPVSKTEPVQIGGRMVGKEQAAWDWIRASCPWPWIGVWYNDHPGLWWGKTVRVIGHNGQAVDVVDMQVVQDAIRVAGRNRGQWGSLPSPEIVKNEAIAYTPWLPGEHKRHAHHAADVRHPHIVPVRTRGQYHYLRRTYNVADGWALDYMPRAVIAQRWGKRKSYEQRWREAERREVTHDLG